jgi:hypothetical protein
VATGDHVTNSLSSRRGLSRLTYKLMADDPNGTQTGVTAHPPEAPEVVPTLGRGGGETGRRGDAAGAPTAIAAGGVSAVEVPPATEARAAASQGTRQYMYYVLTVLILFVGVLTFGATWVETNRYDAELNALRGFAERDKLCFTNYMLYSASLSPYRSFILLRNGSLFLSFIIVLVGGLFVLGSAPVAYGVSGGWGERARFAMSTTSPGLVLTTIGAALVAASLYRSASPTFEPLRPPLDRCVNFVAGAPPRDSAQ